MSLQSLKNVSKRQMAAVYVVAAVLLVGAGALWWFKVSTDPHRVFHNMLAQSLRTSAVTVQANQENNGTKVHQTLQFSLAGNNRSHGLTTISQGNTTVVDELIGTKTADYTRYVSVHTDQKGKNGKPLDFSKVLGVWAKNGGTSSTGSGQLLSQAVLGTGMPMGGVAVPMGNFNASQTTKLMQVMENGVVYKVDYTHVKHHYVRGRLQYTYNVDVEPVAYANMMQRFGQALGLHDFDQLNPASFQGRPPLKMRITVDVHSSHVVSVVLSDGNYTQTYSSYDVPVTVPVPGKTVSVTELQQRLSKIAQ
jgi:hypothetical protein